MGKAGGVDFLRQVHTIFIKAKILYFITNFVISHRQDIWTIYQGKTILWNFGLPCAVRRICDFSCILIVYLAHPGHHAEFLTSLQICLSKLCHHLELNPDYYPDIKICIKLAFILWTFHYTFILFITYWIKNSIFI